MSGFDWATYKDNTFGVNADLSIPIIFDEAPTLPQNAALDEYRVRRRPVGLAVQRRAERLQHAGRRRVLRHAHGGTEGYRGSVLDAEGIALINGLQEVLGAGVTSFDAGDIILGGDGSDMITGLAATTSSTATSGSTSASASCRRSTPRVRPAPPRSSAPRISRA